MDKLFTRNDFSRGSATLLRRGRSANAYVYRYCHGAEEWVVKDFRPCWPVVRDIWGTWMTRRECFAMQRLNGIEGFPQEAFRLDRYALCYRYIPGTTIREVDQGLLTGEFFVALECLVGKMHERNIVHLDIRYRWNVLITDDRRPALLDFQTHLCLDRVPHFLHRQLKNTDLSGVYKQWRNRAPDSIDKTRLRFLENANRKRRLWLLKGYAGLKRRRR